MFEFKLHFALTNIFSVNASLIWFFSSAPQTQRLVLCSKVKTILLLPFAKSVCFTFRPITQTLLNRVTRLRYKLNATYITKRISPARICAMIQYDNTIPRANPYYFHVIEFRDCLLLATTIFQDSWNCSCQCRCRSIVACEQQFEAEIPETLLPAFQPHKRNTLPCVWTSRFRLALSAKRGMSMWHARNENISE